MKIPEAEVIARLSEITLPLVEMMQRGVDLWQAAGFLGMTVQQLERGYGHHHPDYQEEAVAALGGQHAGRNPVNKTRQTSANVTKIDENSRGK
jgi:hypothetical protein